MSFDLLFEPVEALDEWLTTLIEGAPLLVALGVAFVLGLRHASDPDHLVAVTSLVAADGGDVRAATRLGAWWGIGHAATLLAVGLPLIAFKSQLPGWLESGAETGVGLVILVLAARVIFKWLRGDYRAGPHVHAQSLRARITTTTATCATARARAMRTATCARRGRRSASGCCTASPAPARSSCC